MFGLIGYIVKVIIVDWDNLRGWSLVYSRYVCCIDMVVMLILSCMFFGLVFLVFVLFGLWVGIYWVVNWSWFRYGIRSYYWKMVWKGRDWICLLYYGLLWGFFLSIKWFLF